MSRHAPEPRAPAPTRRLTNGILVGVALPLMLVGLVDPLEGMLLIALAAVPAAAAAYRVGSHTLKPLLGGLAVLGLTFGTMVAASLGVLPISWQPWTLIPWIGAGYLLTTSTLILARRLLMPQHRRLAIAMVIAVAVVMALLTVRLGYGLWRYSRMGPAEPCGDDPACIP